MPIPVRMFWNAVSTFVESRADVSMKDSVFFSRDRERDMRTDRLKQSHEVKREGERRANLHRP